MNRTRTPFRGLVCTTVMFMVITPSILAGTMTDIDGNLYQTVVIGGQEWMAENLKVVHYRNGDPIANVTDLDTWQALATGAYCEYANDTSIAAIYGRLYNWFAVSDSRQIAPAGWHVPTDEEWKQLEIGLGLSPAQADAEGYRGTTEGGKLKEAGTVHWYSPNTGATNAVGFAALPGGGAGRDPIIDPPGFGIFLNEFCEFWTYNEKTTDLAYRRHLAYNLATIYRDGVPKTRGYSLRCVKDTGPRCGADVDGSGSIDISDLSMLVDFLFFGASLPACP